MNKVAARARIALILVLALVAGFVFFICEFAVNAKSWVVFPGSPHVYNGGNIGCGGITDRQGITLLDTTQDRVYSSDEALRKATVHWLGDRYGRIDAPALSHYSAQLAGFDLLGGVYSYGGVGGVAQLTLSARAQKAALEAMGDRKGTVAVYNYKTGEILCAATTPTYDPDDPPDLESDTTGTYEGLYLNRFVQSTYIPGSIFKIVTLAAALESIPDIQEQSFVCTGSYAIGEEEVTCEGIHWDQNLKDAFRNSCNCTFAQIALQLGKDKLQEYANKFGITESVNFDGITTSAGNFDINDADQVSLSWAAIGQYTDQINPCAFMTFMGAVASEGQGVQPYLVEEIAAGGSRTYSASTQKGSRLMSRETAQILQEYLQYNVDSKYGAENFPGLTVCAKTGTAEVGGDKKPNAMLAGFVADEEYPLAFIVAVEDGGYGSQVCIPIASKVLTQCKTVLDMG